MYFPTTRVLTVLELLQSHQRLSGPELAKRLEVDTRTVRRYITMLQDLGIPVETSRGRYGYYRLRPGFKLPPLMFNDDEAFALTIGLIAARKLDLAVAAPAVEGALAKIERVLPVKLLEQVRAVQQTLVFNFNASSVAPASEIVITLSVARMQASRIWMHYQGWKSEVTERALDPYGIVCRAGFWYVVGYCHLRAELRTFRLDRILHVEILDETFQPPQDFDCAAFAARALASMPVGSFIEVLLDTTLENVQRWIPADLAILEQTQNGVIFRCYADNLDWIAHLLLGLRCPLIIRQPAELCEAMRRLAERAKQASAQYVPYSGASLSDTKEQTQTP
jgi:predicted DNA-binding transcriptional regulator YafY